MFSCVFCLAFKNTFIVKAYEWLFPKIKISFLIVSGFYYKQNTKLVAYELTTTIKNMFKVDDKKNRTEQLMLLRCVYN